MLLRSRIVVVAAVEALSALGDMDALGVDVACIENMLRRPLCDVFFCSCGVRQDSVHGGGGEE